MDSEGELSTKKVIDCMAVIDIDPSLTQFKTIYRVKMDFEHLTSFLNAQRYKAHFEGLFIVINYCEKNRLPIYEIDFIPNPTSEWVAIKMPVSVSEKIPNSYLCYKTEQVEMLEPLGDIQVLNTEKKSHLGHDKEVVNVPNGYKVLSNPIFHSFLIYKRMKSRLQQTFRPIILQHYPQSPNVPLDLIPSFCFPEGIKLSKELKGFITFNYVLTHGTGDRLYVTYLTFKELLKEAEKNKLKINLQEKIYYDKGICVMSNYRFSDELSECLQHLYRLSMSRNDQPFHKVAANFVDELKLPKSIENGFSYSYSGCNINFDYNPVSQKISDKSIYCIFKFLPLEQILTVFRAILYEKHVIFVSQSKTILGYAIEAFTSLIFPFRWENVIIPIVPITLKEYLTAPMPFLAGITSTHLLDPSNENDALIVLLDSGKVLNEEDMPPLPQKLGKQLHKKLESYQLYKAEEVKDYLENPQNTYMFKMMEFDNPQFQSIDIREIFLEFFLTLMKNYKKYWKSKFLSALKDTFSKSNEQLPISEMFKVQDFLSDLGMNKVGSFGYKFTEGTIFTAFLERRYQDPNDLVANFFDECLEKKKSKKQSPVLTKADKVRYIVTSHPKPETEKIFYSYERFPSILPQPHENEIFHSQISLKIEEDEILSETEFYEFIEEQSELSQGFFETVNENDFKQEETIPILNMLTNKNKDLFIEKKKSNKTKKVYQIFREVYEAQNSQLEQLFLEWPRFGTKQCQFVSMQKAKYFELKIQKKLPKQSLIGVNESGNYQMLIRGSSKILITNSQSHSESLRVSSKKPTHSISICISNYKIRSFINELIPIQYEEIFDFIYERAKNGADHLWTVQTVIEMRSYLSSLAERDSSQGKDSTHGTRSK